jgi:hypothetical protein
LRQNFSHSKHLRRGVKSANENNHEQRQDEPEPPLDEFARGLARHPELRRCFRLKLFAAF